MRGTVRKISMPRRHIADLMHASHRVPFVSLTRTLDIRQLLEARAVAAQPPGWAAIFVKAFALVAKEQPTLRTLYAKWPWPSFYELPYSVAMVAIARVEDGQDCVLPQKVPAPDRAPLGRDRRADPPCQGGAGRRSAGVSQDPAGDAAAAAAAASDLAGRAEFRAPARQLVRQFRGDLGCRLRRRPASGGEPGAIYPQLRRGRGPRHRCRDPLGSPGLRRGPDRQDADPAGTGAEQ